MSRLILFLGLVLSVTVSSAVTAEEPDWDLTPRPVYQIPPGTRFRQGPPRGWSNLILFVEGNLASGDLDVVSKTVAYYSKLFNVVILANAKQDTTGIYYLDKVGFGFAMKIKGQNTIVTSATQRKLGGGLSFIGSQVLAANETAVHNTTQLARSRGSMIVDAPTIMLNEGEHEWMICRFVFWVGPKTGKIGAAVWLLDDHGEPSDDYRICEDVFQCLPENMREERLMNVRADRFTLGIPAKDAFAVVQIPQGTPFPFTDELRAHAGARRFNTERYRALWSSMAAAMAQAPGDDSQPER